MNAIAKDFLSEMNQIETDDLDSKLPVILAEKVERFVGWLVFSDNCFYPESDNDWWCDLERCLTDDTKEYYTLPELYQHWLDNVDGK